MNQSRFRLMVNGFEIVFLNGFRIIAKNGYGTETTHNQSHDLVDRMAAGKFGGTVTPDIEVEVYDNAGTDISDKFQRTTYLDSDAFAKLQYMVSRLKQIKLN